MPDIPPTRPAANARSPNRKPRYRTAMRNRTRLTEKEVFLRVYALAGYERAAEAITLPGGTIGQTKRRVWEWAQEDKDFLGEWHEAKEKYLANIKPTLDGLTITALGVIESTMEGVEIKPETRLDAAKSHLKGTGVYSDKSHVNLDANIKHVSVIEVVRDSDTD